MRSGTDTAFPAAPVWSIPREEPTAHDALGKLPMSISRRSSASIVTSRASLHRNGGAGVVSIANFPFVSSVYVHQIRLSFTLSFPATIRLVHVPSRQIRDQRLQVLPRSRQPHLPRCHDGGRRSQ